MAQFGYAGLRLGNACLRPAENAGVMPIALHFNPAARLRLQEISGRTIAREFSMLLHYYATHRDIANADVFTFIDPDAELVVTPRDMRGLREGLLALQARVAPAVVLRSAWICPSVGAWAVLEEWLRERHSRDGMATEVILVANLEEAASLFDRGEIACVATRQGFEPSAEFSAEPAAS